MFLLGRGELYLTFLDMASTMMRGAATATLSYDINAAFKVQLWVLHAPACAIVFMIAYVHIIIRLHM